MNTFKVFGPSEKFPHWTVTGDLDEDTRFHNLAFDAYVEEEHSLTLYKDDVLVAKITDKAHAENVVAMINSLKETYH